MPQIHAKMTKTLSTHAWSNRNGTCQTFAFYNRSLSAALQI